MICNPFGSVVLSVGWHHAEASACGSDQHAALTAAHAAAAHSLTQALLQCDIQGTVAVFFSV
jgi:hypothetical protein